MTTKAEAALELFNSVMGEEELICLLTQHLIISLSTLIRRNPRSCPPTR